MMLVWFAAAHAYESLGNGYGPAPAFVPPAFVVEEPPRFLFPFETWLTRDVERGEGASALRWTVASVPPLCASPVYGARAEGGLFRPSVRNFRKTEAVELFPASERTPLMGGVL